MLLSLIAPLMHPKCGRLSMFLRANDLIYTTLVTLIASNTMVRRCII